MSNFPLAGLTLPRQPEVVRGLAALFGLRTHHFPLHAHAALPGRLSLSTQSRLGFFNCSGTRCRFTSPSAHDA